MYLVAPQIIYYDCNYEWGIFMCCSGSSCIGHTLPCFVSVLNVECVLWEGRFGWLHRRRTYNEVVVLNEESVSTYTKVLL